MRQDRTYTLDEAIALIPQVRATLLQLSLEKRRFDEAVERLHVAAEGGDDRDGDGSLARQEEWVREIGEGIKALAGHLEQLGVQLRDVDSGLVDIPTERDGEQIWFCWRLADPTIAYWHTDREGFANRRPL